MVLDERKGRCLLRSRSVLGPLRQVWQRLGRHMWKRDRTHPACLVGCDIWNVRQKKNANCLKPSPEIVRSASKWDQIHYERVTEVPDVQRFRLMAQRAR